MLNELRQVYDIALDPHLAETVLDIQLARASDEDLLYAVLLDYRSHKQIYFVRFTKSDPRPSVAPKHHVLRVTASLEAVVELVTPSLASVYQTITVSAQRKRVSGREFIDGVSLVVGPTRIDLDFRFHQSGSEGKLVTETWAN